MARKKLARTVFGSGEDRGVSPVIGVILMVAITVILAAVIGTMVLGMTDSVGKNVQAGANAELASDGNSITITYTTSQNAISLSVSVNGEEVVTKGGALSDVGNSVAIDVDGDGTNDEDVQVSAANAGSPYHVVITAHNGDTSTVVVDKTL